LIFRSGKLQISAEMQGGIRKGLWIPLPPVFIFTCFPYETFKTLITFAAAKYPCVMGN